MLLKYPWNPCPPNPSSNMNNYVSPWMDEDLSIFRDAAARFLEAEMVPNEVEWRKQQHVGKEIWLKAGSTGLLCTDIPAEYGGVGGDFRHEAVLYEELARRGLSGFGQGVHSICAHYLVNHGTKEQKHRFLPRMASGELIGAIGMTEPGAGSDLQGIRTRAVRDGDDYVINGGKMWITNGVQADWICLLANTSDGQVHRNKSLICVPMKSKGVEVARKLDKMGMRSSDTAQIFFDDVRVPKRNRIGEEGHGFTYQMLQFQEERLWGAAACLKAHEYIIAETIEYTRNRKAFGQSILDNQTVHFKLAEMQTEVELLRALIYRAAEALIAGEDVTRLATMAKLKAGRLGRELTDACLQFWGGMGFMNETPVSRAYRDSRLTSIGGGADEVMLTVLCKMMGTLPGMNQK